jgi:hypothetical protein
MQSSYFQRGPSPVDPGARALYRLDPALLELLETGGPKARLAELHNVSQVVAAPQEIRLRPNGDGYYIIGRPAWRWVSLTRRVRANAREIFVIPVDRGLVVTDFEWHDPRRSFPLLGDQAAEEAFLDQLGQAVLRQP